MNKFKHQRVGSNYNLSQKNVRPETKRLHKMKMVQKNYVNEQNIGFEITKSNSERNLLLINRKCRTIRYENCNFEIH